MSPNDLTRLIDERLRDTISAADFAELEDELRRNPVARREWRRAANLDAALHDWAEANPELQAWKPAAVPRPWFAPRIVWWSAAAAMLALVAVWNAKRVSGQAPGIAAMEQTAQGCASLAQSAAAEWAGGTAAARRGDTLDTGPLTLNKGLAQIEFFCGATIVVEGPAAFEIVSAWEVVWHYGKVRVHVPPAARGFRLNTPGMKLVDLGTEFGVEVDRATQQARLAVFSGEVVAHPLGAEQLHLREGDGLQKMGATLERIPAAAPDEFINTRNLQTLTRQHAQTRFAAWEQFAAQVATDPRLIAYYPLRDAGGWNRIVRDTTVPRNPLHDGGAVGVRVAPGRWSEKPALEFKRPGDRVRLQLEGTYNAITLACWVKVDALDRRYNALFLTDGYEMGEPHWQIYEDGRLMFSIKYTDIPPKHTNHIFYSPIVFDSSTTGRWHHVAVTYDNQSGEVVQFMDGREVSREVSPLLQPGQEMLIGACELGNWGLPTKGHLFPVRNLNGSLDEFAIYRAALRPAEILALYEAGRPD